MTAIAMKIFQKPMKCPFLLLCLFFTVLPLPLAAQHDVFIDADNYHFEQVSPVSLVTPKPPMSGTGPGPEGWIRLLFTIKADGSTANVDVLDVMPSKVSLKDALAAVAEWRFEPAVIDNMPVDWHNNIVVIDFDLPEIPNITGPQFSIPYSEVNAMINSGNLEQAGLKAGRNIGNLTFSMHDIGLGNMQLATIAMQRQDMYLAHRAITRATLAGVNQLTDEELDVALQYRFTIELALGRYMDALDTFDRRASLVTIEESDLMAQQAEQIQRALDENVVLNARGKILDRDWFFVPSRRTFTIADVDGKLDHIEAVCNRKRTTLSFQADVEWSLPDSWGECSLLVAGDRGTTFTFYEFTN